MPLHDHFRPPLSERRPWESFHSTWCGSLADLINHSLAGEPFIALPQVHHGPSVEIDVGTFSEGPAAGGPVATRPRAVWLPAAPPLVLPGAFPDRFAVEVHSTEGGRTLVAAIELVSPGNKGRESKRRLFAAKCASYLARGVGLVIVDAVTTRQANLHDELAHLLDLPDDVCIADRAPLYAVAYRPLTEQGRGRVECWPFALALGAALPAVPLSLSAERCLELDLEAAYAGACLRQRIAAAVA